MPRIGDTIRPELQRADTSGMLKGAAIGAEAMGQGLAALGAGVGQGLEKRKAIKDFTKEKEVQATALAKFLPEDSPFKEMAQGAADFLNDPENRQSERFAFAKTMEPNFKLASDAMSTGFAAKTMQLQASARKGQAMGLADFVNSQGDPEKLAEISIGTLKELGEDQEAVNAYKSSAMQAILAQQKGTGTLSVDSFKRVNPKTGKVEEHQFMKQGSKILQMFDPVPVERHGVLAGDERLTYEEKSARQTAALKGQEERLTAQPKLEQSTAGLAKALNIIGTNTVYSGVGGNQVKFLNEVGAALGFDKAKLKAKNAQVLLVEYGKEVMGQIQLTKGAVSEKEMAYFSKISPGLDKLPEANAEILRNKLKYADRELKIGRMVRELQVEGKTSQEIEAAINQYYIDNRVLTDEYIDAALKAGGFETEPVKTTRELSEDDATLLDALSRDGKVQPPGNPPGPDDKKVDLRYSRPGHPQFPRAQRTRKTGIPEWYANPEGRSAFEQVRDTPGAPGTFEGYSNLSSAEKLALRDEALEGAPRAVRVPEAPVPGAFKVLDTHRATPATRTALKGVKYVISTDFNAGKKGKPAPAPGIEVVVPKHAPAGAVSKVKQYLKETEAWMRSKGVKTSIRTTGKNKDGVIYEGKSSRFYYTEPFFKTDADSRKAIEKDPRGYARILARTLGTLPGVTFIPPHTARDKGAELPGSNISEQAWALKHVIPYLQELSTR